MKKSLVVKFSLTPPFKLNTNKNMKEKEKQYPGLDLFEEYDRMQDFEDCVLMSQELD